MGCNAKLGCSKNDHIWVQFERKIEKRVWGKCGSQLFFQSVLNEIAVHILGLWVCSYHDYSNMGAAITLTEAIFGPLFSLLSPLHKNFILSPIQPHPKHLIAPHFHGSIINKINATLLIKNKEYKPLLWH